jgi:Flp pilus assembly protein TadD
LHGPDGSFSVLRLVVYVLTVAMLSWVAAMAARQLVSGPRGEEWAQRESTVEVPLRNGSLFTDARMVAPVRADYARFIDAWAKVICEELGISTSVPLTVYFFYDRAGYLECAGDVGRSERASYQPSDGAIYVHGNFLLGQMLGLDEAETLAHELVHRVIDVAWDEIPVALDEAIAEYLSCGVLVDGHFCPGLVGGNRLAAVDAALEQGGLLPLAELLSPSAGGSDEPSLLVRGQGALLLEWLREQGSLRRFLAAVGASTQRDGSAVAAFEAVTRQSVGAAQSAFAAWLAGRRDLWAFSRGADRVESGDDAGATRYFEEATRIAPRRGQYWHELATNLAICGRGDDATAALERAMQCDPFPRRQGARLALAHAHFAAGRHERAAQLYEAALVAGPVPHVVYKNLATHLVDTDPKRALALVERGLALPRDGLFVADRVKELERLREEIRGRVPR